MADTRSPSIARSSPGVIRAVTPGGEDRARPTAAMRPNGAATATSSGRCSPTAASSMAAQSAG